MVSAPEMPIWFKPVAPLGTGRISVADPVARSTDTMLEEFTCVAYMLDARKGVAAEADNGAAISETPVTSAAMRQVLSSLMSRFRG